MSVGTGNAPDFRGARCVVTGAGGFLGIHLCRRLAASGAAVHALGRVQPPALTDVTWHRCDVTDLAQVRVALGEARPDFIFHLAGVVTGSRAIEMVLPTFLANLAGTVHVLLGATEVGAPRVVCLGSLQEPDEAIRGAPCSPYAASKYGASAYARLFAEIFALQVSIARPFMVYGPGQLDLTKLVPYVMSQLLRGKAAELSSGRQTFDWVYVDDVVDSLLATIWSPGMKGATVDVGCGVLTSVRDVALGLGRRLGAVDRVRLDVLPDRSLEQTRQGDIEATARLIGWRPQVSLEEGLDRTVAWYRERFAGQRA
ncbi:MAG TPA: NAD-dependent epimerase/dehydratase family protein [Steroidobacteraceae bacterium]|nr:NAD-dependent epimerase/dehydratase family protein [Steroidobacteraceae bacterium]